MSDRTHAYTPETKSSPAQIAHREELVHLFETSPLPPDQLLVNLGLYMRSSALAKILFLDELYRHIVDQPGIIMEFGSWWGQNLVVFENLRAIYEPFNQSRRIVGFDTFAGYPSISVADRASDTIKVGGYAVGEGYRDHLERLVDHHEKNNVLAAVKKHETVEGDVAVTVPQWLERHPETVIALAYFDMALYEPTRVALESILPYLVPGSVVMLDELNASDYPGETIAFREVLAGRTVRLEKSKFMTDRTLLIIG